MAAAAMKPKPAENSPSDDIWVSLPEASRLLGKHREQVLAFIVRGELIADVRGRWTWVSRESIDRWLAANAK